MAQDVLITFNNAFSSVANTQAALNAVDPLQDQKLYASFNRRPFSKPEDWAFEPCDRYYDTVCMLDFYVLASD